MEYIHQLKLCFPLINKKPQEGTETVQNRILQLHHLYNLVKIKNEDYV